MPRESGPSLSQMRGKRLALAALALAASLLGGCQFSRMSGARADSSRQWSQQAAAAMENGHWQQAESLLQQAVQSNPEDSVARGRLAQALWQRGEKQAAIAQLEGARQLAPHDSELTLQAAGLYLEVGDFERARRAAEQVIDREPRSARGWILRGQAWQASGDPNRALADFQRGLQYAPNDRFALEQISGLYRTLHQPQRSLSSLQALAATYPPREEPAELFFAQGLAYQALGRHEDAADRLRLAAERGPPNADVWCALGEAELAAGYPDRAHDVALRALSLVPDHAEARRLVDRVVAAAPATANLRR